MIYLIKNGRHFRSLNINDKDYDFKKVLLSCIIFHMKKLLMVKDLELMIYFRAIELIEKNEFKRKKFYM